MKDIYQILKTVYGYDKFRPGQEEIIRNLLSCRDVMAIMPTGAGKSLCYQIPALASDGITLVISPLISLMQDQVRALIANGVRAAYLNSTLTPGQLALATENARKGMYRIIYVAPERLETESFLRFACTADISLIAVDEAHCISLWGQDFRPGYMKISDFISRLPKRPPVAAFTATATKRVRDDIIKYLELEDPFCCKTEFDRPNLYLGVYSVLDKLSFLISYISRHKEQSGIIYCITRRETETIAGLLSERGFSAKAYHAGMSDEERRRVQEDFTYDRTRIIAATNAFGMGIDKPDVRYVIHFSIPGSPEDYYQQAGRAGRDGEQAECILLYSGKDVRLQSYMISKISEKSELTSGQIDELIAVNEDKLRQMTYYATSTSVCLRRRLMDYFGERPVRSCKGCSVCLGDITERCFGKKEKSSGDVDEALLARLRTRVRLISVQYSVPVYSVVGEPSLRELAELKPKTVSGLHGISGFGEERIRRFGQQLIDVINDYEKESDAKQGPTEE